MRNIFIKKYQEYLNFFWNFYIYDVVIYKGNKDFKYLKCCALH